MADVRYDLEVSDNVAAPLREAAAAAKASADAHDEATKASREAAEATKAEERAAREAAQAAQDAADAQRRLADVVLAVASAEERARALHERRRAEIVRLTAVSGDASAGVAAMAANDKLLARSLAEVADQAADAQRKLQDIAGTSASAEDRARVAHARRREEIERLAAVSGDSAAAQAAMAANDSALARVLMGGSAATDRAAKSTGGLGRALQAVGQQMPDVVTQLQMGANPMTVLTQQGSQVAEVLMYTAGGAGGLASALGALVPVLVAVAAGVGALVMGWKAWNGDLEANQGAIDEANTRARLAGDAYARLRIILEDTRDTLRDLKVATGEMSAEQAKLADASEAAYRRWQDATRETRAQLAELQRDQQSVSTQIVDGFRAMIEAVDEFAGFDPTADLGAFDYLFTTGAEIQGRIDAITGVVGKSTEALDENAAAHEQVIKAQKEKEDREKSGHDATKAATKAEREREQALQATYAAMTAASKAAGALLRGPLSERDRLIEAADNLYSIATAAGTSARQAFMLEEQIQALLDRVAELDAAPEIKLRLEVTAAVDALTKSIDEAIVQGVVVGGRVAAQEIERQRLTIADALGVVSAGGGGGSLTAAGNALMSAGMARAVSGGRGAAMAGIGGALAATGGAVSAGVAAVRVVAGLDKMEAGIKAVAGAAIDNLKHLDTILPGIVEALGMAAGQILVNLPDILAGLVTGIVRGLVDLAARLLDGLKALGRSIVAAVLPGQQEGEPGAGAQATVNKAAGAVLGGVAGFVLGGPVGAAAGAAAGAAVAEKVADMDKRLHNMRVTASSAPMMLPTGSAPMGGPVGVVTGERGGERDHVVINVHARPMLAMDRQTGQQLTGSISKAVAVQRFTTAPLGRRTR